MRSLGLVSDTRVCGLFCHHEYQFNYHLKTIIYLDYYPTVHSA